MYMRAFGTLNRSRKEALSITDMISYANAMQFDDLDTFILMMQAADEVYLTHYGYGS